MSEWVSVKDKKPEDDRPVIVYHDGLYDKTVIEGWYDNDTGLFFVEGYTVSGVTHWMPMPEPPK